MAAFRYSLVNSAGMVARGVVEAVDRQQALAQITPQARYVLSIEPENPLFASLKRLKALAFAGGGGRRDVLEIARNIGSMSQAGFDLDTSMQLASQSARSKRVAQLIEVLRRDVREGASFADALTLHPATFDSFFIAMARSGEAAGRLGEILVEVADMIDRNLKLRADLTSALTYPGIVLLVATGAILFLLTNVIPQFAPLFAQGGKPIPADAAFLIALGKFASDYGWFLPPILLGLVLLTKRLSRKPERRVRLEALALKTPLFGEIVRASEAARFGRVLGTLLRNGVTLTSALPIASGVLATLSAGRAVHKASGLVAVGTPLAQALSSTLAFPNHFILLLQLGERTGRLGEMSVAAAELANENVRRTTQRVLVLLPPAITILMGLVVGAVVSTILSVMISLNDVAF